MKNRILKKKVKAVSLQQVIARAIPRIDNLGRPVLPKIDIDDGYNGPHDDDPC